jgi:hypothetical protein
MMSFFQMELNLEGNFMRTILSLIRNLTCAKCNALMRVWFSALILYILVVSAVCHQRLVLGTICVRMTINMHLYFSSMLLVLMKKHVGIKQLFQITMVKSFEELLINMKQNLYKTMSALILFTALGK